MLESGSWGHSVLQTPALVFFFFNSTKLSILEILLLCEKFNSSQLYV